MKIALGQITSIPNNPEYNLKKISDFCNQAKEKNCELIIFPEIADFGYNPQLIKELSPKTLENDLCEIAKKYSINLVSGHLSLRENKYFNSQITISSNGEIISIYDKIHLIDFNPFNERSVFTCGNDIKTFKLDNIIFGHSICYDLRFPELYRKLRQQKVEVILCSSCWPAIRLEQKITLAKARAIENQSYFIAVTASGEDLSGNSMVISPTGEIISQAKLNEELITYTLDLNLVNNLRTSFNNFKDIKLL